MDEEELFAFRDAAKNLERDTVARAEMGDAEAARDVLDMAITGLLSGSISDSVRYYLAERLRLIVEDGEEPKAALGIIKPKHRPAGTGAWTPEPVSAAVELLARNAGKVAAVRAVGEALGMSEGTVYRHAKDASWTQKFDEDLLRSAAGAALSAIRRHVMRDPDNPNFQEVLGFLIAE